MTTGGQSEDLENSESEIKRPAGNGSGGAAPQKGASSFSLARRGSGPRTVQGKEKSKHNALKHGIFSKVVVLPGESQAEFDALLNGLCEDFHPVGTFEEGLVETLAATRWRQRRLLIAEGAEIRAGREFVEWDLKQRQLDEAARFPPVHLNGGLVAKISNPEVLGTCLRLLRVLKINVETHGFGTDNATSILTRLYGVLDEAHWKQTLFREYRIWSIIASYPDDVRKKGEFPSLEEGKSYFLNEIEEEMTRLLAYELERSSIESDRMKLESLRRNVPDSTRLDSLLRYAASLERTLDRTLHQLERAQRMRLGQPLPPNINVTVSRQ